MMDSSILIAVRMVLVGYLVFMFMVFMVKPKVCLFDHAFVGLPLVGSLLLMFWHYEYWFFAGIGMHIGMIVVTLPWAWNDIHVRAR